MELCVSLYSSAKNGCVSRGCFEKNKDLPTVSCTAVDEETVWKGKIMIVSMRPHQTTDREYSSHIGVQIPYPLKQQGIPLYEAENPAAKRSLVHGTAWFSHGELRATRESRYKKPFHERLHRRCVTRMDSFRRSGMNEERTEVSEEGRQIGEEKDWYVWGSPRT
jgi:hypothetical protein